MEKFLIRLLLSLFILTIAIQRQVLSAVVLADFQQQSLIEHNLKRQLHCTGPMILNSTLNTIAQNYAQYLATNNLFQHSGAAGLGENLWSMWSSAVITFINGSTPTNSWYSEISSYNYSSPGFSSSTGHFTQVIWNGSTQLGIGIAFTSDNKTAYVVANYYPAGNVIGSFPANVLPLCSNSTTTAATTTTTNAKRNSAVISNQINIRLTTTIVVVIVTLFNLVAQSII